MSDGDRSDPVYIDTVDGDDKNDGATMATALRSYDEYFRRSMDDFDEGAEAGLHVVVIDPSKSDVEIAALLARKEGLVRLLTAPVGERAPGLGLALTSSTNPDIKQAEPVRMNRSMRMAKASLEKRLKKRGARIVETTQRAWTSGLGGETQGIPGFQGEGSGGTRR